MPRVNEILEELYDKRLPEHWRSVTGAKKAVREALAKIKEGVYEGNIPKGTAGVDFIRQIEREFCGE